MGRREVIRKLGELMTLRMAVNTQGGGLEETPEVSIFPRWRVSFAEYMAKDLLVRARARV
jgi:hypothetical protein